MGGRTEQVNLLLMSLTHFSARKDIGRQYSIIPFVVALAVQDQNRKQRPTDRIDRYQDGGDRQGLELTIIPTDLCLVEKRQL